MRNNKKLLIFLLVSNLIFCNENVFRGLSMSELSQKPIPLSFRELLSDNYDVNLDNLKLSRGSFLIICPDIIIPYLDNFISFKKSQGFDTYAIPLSQSGATAESIKEVIFNRLSDDPMLEYVLLIGDVDGFAAVPSFYYGPENDVSDQKYTHIAGGDNIPDIFIGRLSIDSLSDFAVMVSKTIKYVRDPLLYDGEWLGKALVVAGNYSNTYPIPITPRWTSLWLRQELGSHKYNQVDTVFYPPLQQGAPHIVPIIDDGVGIVNYRGWGDANGWHYPEFHVNDVSDLNNGWLTPVFFSYVCNSNDFANNVDPCFSEAILRGGTPNVPKGGVAFIGPSDLHTSTKYNNVINAYMYDAMLNSGVTELGPAMLAGQMGLNKEFPSQDGPGEAQEFYASVYNILGDPSLPVYIGMPSQFDISVNQISTRDGLLRLSVRDTENKKIDNVVISVMSGGELLSKGITDINGDFVTSVNLEGITEVKVFANKGGFIQGNKIVSVQSHNENLSITSLSLNQNSANAIPTIGELISVSITLKNTTDETLYPSNGSIVFSDGAYPNYFPIEIPEISSGSSHVLDQIELEVYNQDSGYTKIGTLWDASGDTIGEFAIDLRTPFFSIKLMNEISPGSAFSPIFLIDNHTDANFTNLNLDISPISDGANVIVDANSDSIFFDIHSFSSIQHETNYILQFHDVAYGSDVTFKIELKKNGKSIFVDHLVTHFEPTSINYPVAPNNYGYWAYDDTDVGFLQRPTFNWLELDPNYGGVGGSHHQLDDDDNVTLDLPFNFKYHGIEYDQITISSNGWASFVPCEINYFWNVSIPMYMGPKALVAPFSDDLETVDTNNDGFIDIWINVYTLHDQENGRYIIEWSRALNGYDETTEETFQIILYDQVSMPTNTGDGVIEFQYLEIENVDATKNYSTVGIESPSKNYGTQYSFNNMYAPGAAPLEDNRIIRFTTEAPEFYVASLDIENLSFPEEFSISKAYPNPFNPKVNFDLDLKSKGKLNINIFDILGRKIKEIENSEFSAGTYRISWDGSNNLGKTVSSGTYFVFISFNENSSAQKLMFIK